MSRTRAAHTVIATPELAFLVFAHLTPHDLSQCTRVCKAWSLHLEPILWANYCPKDSEKDFTIPIRILPLIRTAELIIDYPLILKLSYGLHPGPKPAIIPNKFCTNLRRLTVESFDNMPPVPPVPPVVTLLNHNLRLTQLSLPDISLQYDEIPAAISRLRHLQRLSITNCGWVIGASKRGTMLLLQACLPFPDLTELIMDYGVDWSEDSSRSKPFRLDLETIIQESSIARFSQYPSASKIKLLHLPNCGGEMNPLIVPLLTSGLLDLESCTIPWVERCRNPTDIERKVLLHCPKLKHLTYQSAEEGDAYEDDGFAHAFVRGSLRLESFVSSNFSRKYDAGIQPIFSDLVAHHCNTLREFELTECWRLSSRYQQAILSQCRQLRRFWVKSTFPKGSTGFRFTDASKGDWVCMELRELRLTLNLHFDPTDNDSFGSEADQSEEEGDEALIAYSNLFFESFAEREPVDLARKRLFTQIGRLSKLEKLTLDIDRSYHTTAEEGHYRWELTLAYGNLGELAGLKNLRSLRLEADFWSSMGQAEMEFMHEQWPLLDEIVLVGEASKLDTLPHWKWLFSKRPQLVFTTHKQQYIFPKSESFDSDSC